MLHPRLRDIYTSCNLCNTDYDLIWKVSSLVIIFDRLLLPDPGTFSGAGYFHRELGAFDKAGNFERGPCNLNGSGSFN